MPLRGFQDEGEIEDWFETEKERLTDKLYKVSYSRKGFPEAKKKYGVAMQKLVDHYNKEHMKLHKRLERGKKMRQPLVKLKLWWKERKKQRAENKKFRKVEKKKQKFEKEYKKLMKGNKGVI